jgi:Family of unknown function (DUF5995)
LQDASRDSARRAARAGFLAAPALARADDPPFLGWTALLPGLTTEFVPDSDNDCAAAFFDDTAFVNHEDAVFARYYFEAYDDWHAGRTAAVPPAWAIAFRAADQRAVTAEGNILLGINAHVQRDLQFVLAALGLVAPDGSSRKPDHDRVDQFLNRVTDDVYREVAIRFDPTVDDRDLPGTVDDFALY